MRILIVGSGAREHALAWRLAMLEQQDSGGGELLAGYERERRQVSEENAALSLRNYRGVAELSASLGCNPAHAELAASIASTVLPPSVFGGGLALSRNATFMCAGCF